MYEGWNEFEEYLSDYAEENGLTDDAVEQQAQDSYAKGSPVEDD